MSMMNKRNISKYGWKPDLPDFRDMYYENTHSPEATLKGPVVAPLNPLSTGDAVVHNVVSDPTIGPDGFPISVSLRDSMPPVFNQGQLGSCTACAAGVMFAYVRNGGPYSRLQIYYNEREIEGTVNYDAGAYLRDAIQVLVKIGAGSEASWPYIERNFAVPPPAQVLMEASQNKAIEYSRLVTRQDFRNCLAVQQHPFIIGITIYSSFENEEVARTGIVPMPTRADKLIGGHAVCVIGYHSNFNGGDYYEVRNSWGEGWGDGGNFWIPAAYIENQDLATDSWTIRK